MITEAIKIVQYKAQHLKTAKIISFFNQLSTKYHIKSKIMFGTYFFVFAFYFIVEDIKCDNSL